MHRLMNKDKIILRFTVRMIDTDTHKHSHTDLQRRFVLSYFMMDDTIQVRTRVMDLFVTYDFLQMGE